MNLSDSNGQRLVLRSVLTFRYGDHPDRRRERKVFTVDYGHSIAEIDPQTGTQRETFAWHWHPSIQQYDFPHAHISKGIPAHGSLGRRHIPTGRVALEQVLLFLIDDLGVQPTSGTAAEARATLKATLSRFKDWATWT